MVGCGIHAVLKELGRRLCVRSRVLGDDGGSKRDQQGEGTPRYADRNS